LEIQVVLLLAAPTGIETATSNLGVTEPLKRIWGEKQQFPYFLHFTSHFVTFQDGFQIVF